jgi:hypothetical protein
MSRSANSTTTATCRCTRTWSSVINDHRSRHVTPDNALLLPRANGTARHWTGTPLPD